ncbi:unnamed protein product [Psylliodes chrysocephalus]|uniref:Uncharacterized protein n=1 Tax=Psylliodes chrysocephalus TaxID=3402493 RepID=A0A9P0CIZ5_9CUCU|nr:unnamed protein product [Psylliodes chrysocephala]
MIIELFRFSPVDPKYKDDDPDFKKVCDYKEPTYMCENIAVSDVRALRGKIFDTNNKVDQDTKLCHYMSVVPIDRKRAKRGTIQKSQFFSALFSAQKSVHEKNSGTEKFEKLLKPKFSDLDLTIVDKDTKRGIPEKKKKSLQHLLNQQFGLNWKKSEDLQWYRTLLHGNTLLNEEGDSIVEPEGICDSLEEEVAVHI